MKPHFPRPKALRGFTLIEILVVVTIIALLVAILIPVTSRVLQNARINAATAEIITLRQIAADAATRLGGTLPLTEGMTLNAGTTNLQDQIPMNANLITYLYGADANAKLSNLNQLMSLDNVFMSMSPSMMDNFYKSQFGLYVPKTSMDPPLGYNGETGEYTARALTRGRRYNRTDGFGDSSRIECAPVVPTFTPNQVVNTVGGINFRLDGVNWLPAGRCVYMVYVNVPRTEAFELSNRLNPAPLLHNTTIDTQPQDKGRVIYTGGTSVTVTVYVYLANF